MIRAPQIDASNAYQQSKRGFTLTEIAIVLGIIGLILGAIWVAASSVYSNLRVSKTTNQLLSLVQGVRTLYATSSTTGQADGTMTTALVEAGIFPNDTVVASTSGTAPTTAKDVWGGAIDVYSSTIVTGDVGDSFIVYFANVPPANCVTLLTGNTGAGRDTGMYAAGGGSTLGTAPSTVYTSFPFTAASAVTSCGATSTTPTIVGFQFKLKG